MKIPKEQNDSHDWFGDCAESYVAYLFAKAGLEVFATGKWTADLAVHDRNDHWRRIEVKSTDRNRPPRNVHRLRNKKAEFLAEVRLVENDRIQLEMYQLQNGKRLVKTCRRINSAEELKDYVFTQK